MPQQATLAGFAAIPPTDRLFLALFPDPETAGRLGALAAAQCAQHGLRTRPVAAERLHVTLFHLGDTVGLRDDVVAAARRAAEQVRSAPFALTFDRVATFSGRQHSRPLVLTAPDGNEALHAFHAQLGQALRVAGLGRHVATGFTPHVTLAYARQDVATGSVAPITWQADEFVLIHSLLGQTRHVELGRWPL